ncbi:MAG: DNA-directed RNA polymerase [Methanosarcinales archaeon Met12]|nr:MAG: DNA-directed RNA polymerase [Methanosarcinales archaeon Met12]
MYRKMRLVDVVRIPPEKLGDEVKGAVAEALEDKLEGRIDKTLGAIVAITRVVDVGDGRILVGDGAVYYKTTFDAIVYKPEMQEIIEGKIVEIVEFGAFVSMGPVDGLLHVSQIADDYFSYDEKNARLVGKEGANTLAEGDDVRTRIVAVSLNEVEPKESKIGLTMRQTALGKFEWLEDARKKEEAKKEKEK